MVGTKRKANYMRIETEGRYGKYKSRSKKLRYVKTPGGRTVVQYKPKKHSKPTCAGCGAVLAGMPHKKPSELRKLPKTARRPERPYGGYFCSACMRQKIKQGARK